ncbi:hypothetical protein D3C87_1770240 [compost metagenome]
MKHAIALFDRQRQLAERDMGPFRVFRMGEAELLIGRAGDLDAGLGKLARLVRCH